MLKFIIIWTFVFYQCSTRLINEINSLQDFHKRVFNGINRVCTGLENYPLDIVLHYSNKTDEFVKNIFEIDSVCSLKNYDMKLKHSSLSLRPSWHIVYAEDFELTNLEVTPRDLILFICKSYNETTCLQWNSRVLKKIFLTFFMEISENEQKILLYGACHYCGEESQKIALLSSANVTNFEDRFVKAMKGYWERTSRDMNGHLFKVAYVSMKPYFSCEGLKKIVKADGSVETECASGVDGVEGVLLAELSKRMNFRVQLTIGPPKPGVGLYTKTIWDVNESYADWAVGGISFTAERNKYVGFTVSLGRDPVKVLYVKPKKLTDEVLPIILPFDIYTWILLTATVAILTLLFRVFYKIKSSMMICGILVEQSDARQFSNIKGRRFVVTWLLCCVIINNAYRAKINEIMLTSHPGREMSLEDLVDEGYEAYLNHIDSSMTRGFIQNSSEPSMQKLSKRLRNDLQLCEAMQRITTSKSIVIEELNMLSYNFTNDCRHLFEDDDLRRLAMTPDTLYPSEHAWPIGKHAPYKKYVDKKILHVFQAGLFDKWFEKSIKKTGSIRVSLVSNATRSSKAFYGPMVVWSVGITLSIVCFFGELLYCYIKTKYKK